MPVLDVTLVIGRIFRPRRRLELDQPIGFVLDVTLANIEAKLLQVGLLRALVRDEKHIHPIERVDRLDGQVIGIAGADADDQNLAHAMLPYGRRLSRTGRRQHSGLGWKLETWKRQSGVWPADAAAAEFDCGRHSPAGCWCAAESYRLPMPLPAAGRHVQRTVFAPPACGRWRRCWPGPRHHPPDADACGGLPPIIACRAASPSVSAAGPGCRISDDLISWSAPRLHRRYLLEARPLYDFFRTEFLPHHEPMMMSGARPITSSAVTMRSLADLQLRDRRNSLPPAASIVPIPRRCLRSSDRPIPRNRPWAAAASGGPSRAAATAAANSPASRSALGAPTRAPSVRIISRISAMLRWLNACTSMPARISVAAISACKSENVKTRSGFRSMIFAISAEVKAETRGFSRRARGGALHSRKCRRCADPRRGNRAFRRSPRSSRRSAPAGTRGTLQQSTVGYILRGLFRTVLEQPEPDQAFAAGDDRLLVGARRPAQHAPRLVVARVLDLAEFGEIGRTAGSAMATRRTSQFGSCRVGTRLRGLAQAPLKDLRDLRTP